MFLMQTCFCGEEYKACWQCRSAAIPILPPSDPADVSLPVSLVPTTCPQYLYHALRQHTLYPHHTKYTHCYAISTSIPPRNLTTHTTPHPVLGTHLSLLRSTLNTCIMSNILVLYTYLLCTFVLSTVQDSWSYSYKPEKRFGNEVAPLMKA